MKYTEKHITIQKKTLAVRFLFFNPDNTMVKTLNIL